MAATFTISRIELKKMLASLGVSDGSIEGMLASMNKVHRHVNAVSFVSMLEKLGIKHKDVNNILRRLGIDDTTITEVFNMLDEQKIQSAFGKVVELKVD